MRTGLLTALAVALLACGGEPKKKDPVYEGALPTMEDVDDSMASLIKEDRLRVPYKPTDPIKGASQPLVTIVEFSDFQCPFCGRFAQTLDEVARAYPDDVRLVFLQFPLPMHPNATLGAQAAVASREQGWFWEMHDLLFKYRTKMQRGDLIGHAKDIGMDVAAFEAALESEETKAKVDFDKAIGARLGVRGTPHFFINGRSRSGALDAAALQELIEQERALAKELMNAGCKREEIYARIMRAARPGGSPPPRQTQGAPDGG